MCRAWALRCHCRRAPSLARRSTPDPCGRRIREGTWVYPWEPGTAVARASCRRPPSYRQVRLRRRPRGCLRWCWRRRCHFRGISTRTRGCQACQPALPVRRQSHLRREGLGMDSLAVVKAQVNSIGTESRDLRMVCFVRPPIRFAVHFCWILTSRQVVSSKAQTSS
jgi:hypothetical protein